MQKSLSAKIASLCVAAGLMFSAAQAQTTVNATLVGGSTIRNDSTAGVSNANNNASGSELLIIGHVAGSGSSRLLRGVLQFNIADLAIPQGAAVQSVKLIMTINQKDANTVDLANLNVGLHEVTQDFDPSLVSWNNAANASGGNPATPWTPAGGGTFAPTALDTQVIVSTSPIGTYTFESAALTALVQQSLSSGESLVNLLLKLESETDINREVLRFALSGATAPRLEITYVPEPGQVGIALGAAVLGLVALRRRMKRA